MDKLVHDDRVSPFYRIPGRVECTSKLTSGPVTWRLPSYSENWCVQSHFFVQGRVTISNDGATLMKLLDIVHPAAKVLADISISQDAEVSRQRGCAFPVACGQCMYVPST